MHLKIIVEGSHNLFWQTSAIQGWASKYTWKICKGYTNKINSIE